MNNFSDRDIVIAVCSLFGIGIVLTPISGIWVWIALALGVWAIACVLDLGFGGGVRS